MCYSPTVCRLETTLCRLQAFSLSMLEGLACVQAIGLSWFATSWGVCYQLQPCKELGSRFFKERSEQFFLAAQR